MNVIFGAFGRTGRVVAALLERERAAVRRVTRQRGQHGRPGGDVAVARLTDEAEVGAALTGARAAYVILPDNFSAESFRAERRTMAEVLSRAIARERVPRVVLLSSATAALGEHAANGFGAELAYLERLLGDTGARLTVLRASYFQDNVAGVLASAAQDGCFPNFFESRERAIATIAACDVGEIAARCLLEPFDGAPETVDLVGPSYTVDELARIVGEAVGRRLTIVDVPAATRQAAFESWMSAQAAQAMVETLDCLGSGRAGPRSERRVAGSTRLEQVLRATLDAGAGPYRRAEEVLA